MESRLEKKRARDRLYYERNKERMKAYQRAYYLDNKERLDAMSRLYKQNNPEKMKEYRRAHYMKKKSEEVASRRKEYLWVQFHSSRKEVDQERKREEEAAAGLVELSR